MAESHFPKPIRVGTRAVRWLEQDVLDFIASRPRRRVAAPRLVAVGVDSGFAAKDCWEPERMRTMTPALDGVVGATAAADGRAQVMGNTARVLAELEGAEPKQSGERPGPVHGWK